MPPVPRLPWTAPFWLALAAACDGGQRRDTPVVLLPAADTVLLPYVDVTSATWWGEDRWVVVGEEDAAVHLVDYATGTAAPLGGGGSRDYANPFFVFTADDSLFLADWGLRRLTVWGPDGRLARTIAAADALRGALPRARDAAGHYYAERYPPPRPDGSGNRDSAVVLRATPDLGRVDTVARLSPLDLAEVESDQGRRFERRALSGQDRWGALPDGWLWVARVYRNRVDWRSPTGEWRAGDPLPDRVLEVTRADRELFLRRFPPELRTTAELIPFAVVKPPFETAFTGPERTVWLAKSSAVTDTVRSIQVVNADGELAREVRYPGFGKLVAVGARGILVAEQYAEGVRLLRFPLQGTAPTAAVGSSAGREDR
ncbi:MAG TPA: hypothetical protein VNK43_03740 [Gemmatimonadales bacterium]|nr:hypothetical protein [Gemmatimonadales bacterium]